MSDSADPREHFESLNDEQTKKKEMILDDIVKLLTQVLEISSTDIKADLNLRDDLILDSMELYQLVIDLEEAYDIRLPDEILDRVTTVQDVVDIVYTMTMES